MAPDRDPGSPSMHGPGARRPAWGLAQSNGLYSPGAGDEHPRLLLLRGSRLAPLWPTLVPEPGVLCDELQESGSEWPPHFELTSRRGQAASSLLGKAKEPAAPEGRPRPQRG